MHNPNHTRNIMKPTRPANPRLQLHLATRNAAFTLVELLITITIVIVLAVLVFAGASKMIAKARETDAMQDLKSIQSAAVLYSTDENGDLFFVFDNSGTNGGWKNLWVDKLADSLRHDGKVTQTTGRNPSLYNSKINPTGRWIADYAPNDNIIFSSDVNASPLRRPLKLSRIERPSQEVMFLEGANNSPPSKLPSNTGAFTLWGKQVVNGNFAYPNTVARRHGGDKNPAFHVIYCDGHAERISFNGRFSTDRTLRQTMFSADVNGNTIYK